jgi:hypothetical protein
VRRELWRNAWLAFTPILPAAACQQRHYLKTDSRYKGDVIEVNEGKDQIDFFYLGKLVQSIRKPLRQQTATTRKVQTGGLVKFKQRRIRLDLPKGTYIVILREGQDYLFYLGEQVVFRMTGQEKCHPCI